MRKSGSHHSIYSYKKEGKLLVLVITLFAVLLSISLNAQIAYLSKTKPLTAYKLPIRNHLKTDVQSSDIRTASLVEKNSPEKEELRLEAASNSTTGSFRVYVRGNKEEEILFQILDKYKRTIDSRTIPFKADIKFGYWFHPGVYYVRVIQGDVKKEVKLIKQAE